MIRVGQGKLKWITKYGRCLDETDTMLGKVSDRLLWVPLEFHPRSIPWRHRLGYWLQHADDLTAPADFP
jgi:hypothetical protein